MLGLLAIVAVAAWVTRSSLFEARTITVAGNRHLGRGDVLRLAGVGPQTNLVWFSPGAVEARLEQSPWVLAAEVSRALPSALSISVRERTAIAVVVGKRDYVVSVDRTILGIADPDSDLPEIEAPPGDVRVGGRLPTPNPALEVLRTMPASLRADVQRVAVDRDGLLVAVIKPGIRAVYGDSSDAEAKGRAVQELLRYAARHDIEPESIDVRAPEHPALLPAGGGDPAA